MTLDKNKLKELCEKATKGPWKTGVWYGICRLPEHKGNHPGDETCKYEHAFSPMERGEGYTAFLGVAAEAPGVEVVGTSYDELALSADDAEFIAEARTALPDLLKENSELEERVRELTQKLDLAEDRYRDAHHDWQLENKKVSVMETALREIWNAATMSFQITQGMDIAEIQVIAAKALSDQGGNNGA